MNNNDYFVRMAPVNEYDVDLLEAGNMGKRNYLSDFNRGQIMMSCWLSQSISKTEGLSSVY